MNFQTEKLLILIAAIVGSVGAFFKLLGIVLFYVFKNSGWLNDLPGFNERVFVNFESALIISIISLIFTVMIMIATFVLNKKLSIENHQAIGILSIIFAVSYVFNVVGWIYAVLMLIAGILILVNGNKQQNNQ